MNFLKTITISFLTSATTMLALIYILKQVFTKWIHYEFDKKLKHIENSEALSKSLKEDILKKNISIYPEIAEVVYRLRNLSREASQSEDVYGWNFSQFSEYCYHLTQSLYKYRLFIEEDMFNRLHLFKRLSQDLMITSDICSRPDNIDKSRKIDQATKKRMEEISTQIDQLYSQIIPDLKNIITNYQMLSE